MLIVQPQPLTRETFATFGDVIQIDGSEQFEINSGYTTRVHDLIDIQPVSYTHLTLPTILLV